MAWSYNPQNDTAKDQVRLLIGDTQRDDPQLADEEITYLISTEGSSTRAASAAAGVLAAKFARFADEEVGEVKVELRDISLNYHDLCKKLKDRADSTGVCWLAGGMTKSDKDLVASDLDRVPPFFRRQLHNKKLIPRSGIEGAATGSIDGEELMPLTKTVSIPSGASEISVIFVAPQLFDTYNVSPSWINTVDASPQFQDFVITAKLVTGFTLSWNSPTDSANYQISYTIHEKSP